ncbi:MULTISPECIES: HNH endonuclease [Pseudomonas]|uniref:HNH endonuclease n=1 Tax=Pseudomonas yamanorum TaxID=515393 RepID=A0A7Y8FE49_9PSED|nr:MULTISPECIES: HNH endonuclease [Pseudomonas]MCF5702300.1 HNH endonuclease [Pseudomonas syringae]NWE77717.1 HNH endonuclease [Pseudomonas yamanorum]
MNRLQCALIEKTGTDNGFEHTISVDRNSVVLASARHLSHAIVSVSDNGYEIEFVSRVSSLLTELRRSFPALQLCGDSFLVDGEASLSTLLRRASSLSSALPSQVATSYAQAVNAVLTASPEGIAGTEVERLVRQRVGQQKFREAMLEYWGGACAVTGVGLSEVLRASHAKPWAECASDAERLDVFNGFLLNANLDALFDRFLVSFDEHGLLLVSSRVTLADLQKLGIHPGMRLRWLTAEHQVYLSFHHSIFESLL